MNAPLKQLAKETAVYGLPSILARVLNFLFVSVYTRMLTQVQYGVVTEFLAYIAILQVVLVLGLETGCFRFANKEGEDSRKVYSGALLTVMGLNLAFLALMIGFSDVISSALGYEGYRRLIIYIASILFCDSITAILFAKLRQEHKAVKFAIFKCIKIFTEIGGNLFLFFVYPAKPDFTYPIFAIFISCVLCLVLFVPDLLKLHLTWDGNLVKRMLAYSIPLMVASLPGVANDFADRLLFRFFDTSAEAWRASLGVYQAAVKLAVIMNLFIQMFRYAAEPFFFQQAKEKGVRNLYALVMEYFTAFCAIVFLGVVGYIDIISLFLGRDFRIAIGVVPVMLLSYILLGMCFNVSMWYKLSERTNMAIWITLAGLIVTIVVNIVFMPRYSYWASAFGHLVSYLIMFILSAWLGSKYYPIPYNWKRIGLLLILMGMAYAMMFFTAPTEPGIHWANIALNTLVLGTFATVAWLIVRRRPVTD